MDCTKKVRDDTSFEIINTVNKNLTKISKKMNQDRTHKYWELDLYQFPTCNRYNLVIGKGITEVKAIMRLREGKSVITWYWYDAKKIAYIAGNGDEPAHDKLMYDSGGVLQLGHYHVGHHKDGNPAHSMYIIGG